MTRGEVERLTALVEDYRALRDREHEHRIRWERQALAYTAVVCPCGHDRTSHTPTDWADCSECPHGTCSNTIPGLRWDIWHRDTLRERDEARAEIERLTSLLHAKESWIEGAKVDLDGYDEARADVERLTEEVYVARWYSDMFQRSDTRARAAIARVTCHHESMHGDNTDPTAVQTWTCDECGHWIYCQPNKSQSDAIARVEALHKPIPGNHGFDECEWCQDPDYPCATVRALRGES